MSERYLWGIDPGVSNFAFSICDSGFAPVLAGKIKNTCADMANLPAHIKCFEWELFSLFEKYPPKSLVIERFMNRGKFSGDQGEYVSIMLALVVRHLTMEHPDCVIRIVNSGVWKTAFNRCRGLVGKREKGEATPLERLAKLALCEPHELDAYLMSHYLTDFSHIRSFDSMELLEKFEVVCQGKKKRKRVELAP